MDRLNPTCGHCGGGTIAEGLGGDGAIYHKCYRTGCRCTVVTTRTETKTLEPCLTEDRGDSCPHREV